MPLSQQSSGPIPRDELVLEIDRSFHRTEKTADSSFGPEVVKGIEPVIDRLRGKFKNRTKTFDQIVFDLRSLPKDFVDRVTMLRTPDDIVHICSELLGRIRQILVARGFADNADLNAVLRDERKRLQQWLLGKLAAEKARKADGDACSVLLEGLHGVAPDQESVFMADKLSGVVAGMCESAVLALAPRETAEAVSAASSLLAAFHALQTSVRTEILALKEIDRDTMTAVVLKLVSEFQGSETHPLSSADQSAICDFLVGYLRAWQAMTSNFDFLAHIETLPVPKTPIDEAMIRKLLIEKKKFTVTDEHLQDANTILRRFKAPDIDRSKGKLRSVSVRQAVLRELRGFRSCKYLGHGALEQVLQAALNAMEKPNKTGEEDETVTDSNVSVVWNTRFLTPEAEENAQIEYIRDLIKKRGLTAETIFVQAQLEALHQSLTIWRFQHGLRDKWLKQDTRSFIEVFDLLPEPVSGVDSDVPDEESQNVSGEPLGLPYELVPDVDGKLVWVDPNANDRRETGEGLMTTISTSDMDSVDAQTADVIGGLVHPEQSQSESAGLQNELVSSAGGSPSESLPLLKRQELGPLVLGEIWRARQKTEESFTTVPPLFEKMYAAVLDAVPHALEGLPETIESYDCIAGMLPTILETAAAVIDDDDEFVKITPKQAMTCFEIFQGAMNGIAAPFQKRFPVWIDRKPVSEAAQAYGKSHEMSVDCKEAFRTFKKRNVTGAERYDEARLLMNLYESLWQAMLPNCADSAMMEWLFARMGKAQEKMLAVLDSTSFSRRAELRATWIDHHEYFVKTCREAFKNPTTVNAEQAPVPQFSAEVLSVSVPSQTAEDCATANVVATADSSKQQILLSNEQASASQVSEQTERHSIQPQELSDRYRSAVQEAQAAFVAHFDPPHAFSVDCFAKMLFDGQMFIATMLSDRVLEYKDVQMLIPALLDRSAEFFDRHPADTTFTKNERWTLMAHYGLALEKLVVFLMDHAPKRWIDRRDATTITNSLWPKQKDIPSLGFPSDAELERYQGFREKMERCQTTYQLLLPNHVDRAIAGWFLSHIKSAASDISSYLRTVNGVTPKNKAESLAEWYEHMLSAAVTGYKQAFDNAGVPPFEGKQDSAVPEAKEQPSITKDEIIELFEAAARKAQGILLLELGDNDPRALGAYELLTDAPRNALKTCPDVSVFHAGNYELLGPVEQSCYQTYGRAGAFPNIDERTRGELQNMSPNGLRISPEELKVLLAFEHEMQLVFADIQKRLGVPTVAKHDFINSFSGLMRPFTATLPELMMGSAKDERAKQRYQNLFSMLAQLGTFVDECAHALPERIDKNAASHFFNIAMSTMRAGAHFLTADSAAVRRKYGDSAAALARGFDKLLKLQFPDVPKDATMAVAQSEKQPSMTQAEEQQETPAWKTGGASPDLTLVPETWDANTDLRHAIPDGFETLLKDNAVFTRDALRKMIDNLFSCVMDGDADKRMGKLNESQRSGFVHCMKDFREIARAAIAHVTADGAVQTIEGYRRLIGGFGVAVNETVFEVVPVALSEYLIEQINDWLIARESELTALAAQACNKNEKKESDESVGTLITLREITVAIEEAHREAAALTGESISPEIDGEESFRFLKLRCPSCIRSMKDLTAVWYAFIARTAFMQSHVAREGDSVAAKEDIAKIYERVARNLAEKLPDHPDASMRLLSVDYVGSLADVAEESIDRSSLDRLCNEVFSDGGAEKIAKSIKIAPVFQKAMQEVARNIRDAIAAFIASHLPNGILHVGELGMLDGFAGDMVRVITADAIVDMNAPAADRKLWGKEFPKRLLDRYGTISTRKFPHLVAAEGVPPVSAQPPVSHTEAPAESSSISRDEVLRIIMAANAEHDAIRGGAWEPWNTLLRKLVINGCPEHVKKFEELFPLLGRIEGHLAGRALSRKDKQGRDDPLFDSNDTMRPFFEKAFRQLATRLPNPPSSPQLLHSDFLSSTLLPSSAVIPREELQKELSAIFAPERVEKYMKKAFLALVERTMDKQRIPELRVQISQHLAIILQSVPLFVERYFPNGIGSLPQIAIVGAFIAEVMDEPEVFCTEVLQRMPPEGFSVAIQAIHSGRWADTAAKYVKRCQESEVEQAPTVAVATSDVDVSAWEEDITFDPNLPSNLQRALKLEDRFTNELFKKIVQGISDLFVKDPRSAARFGVTSEQKAKEYVPALLAFRKAARTVIDAVTSNGPIRTFDSYRRFLGGMGCAVNIVRSSGHAWSATVAGEIEKLFVGFCGDMKLMLQERVPTLPPEQESVIDVVSDEDEDAETASHAEIGLEIQEDTAPGAEQSDDASSTSDISDRPAPVPMDPLAEAMDAVGSMNAETYLSSLFETSIDHHAGVIFCGMIHAHNTEHVEAIAAEMSRVTDLCHEGIAAAIRESVASGSVPSIAHVNATAKRAVEIVTSASHEGFTHVDQDRRDTLIKQVCERFAGTDLDATELLVEIDPPVVASVAAASETPSESVAPPPDVSAAHRTRNVRAAAEQFIEQRTRAQRRREHDDANQKLQLYDSEMPSIAAKLQQQADLLRERAASGDLTASATLADFLAYQRTVLHDLLMRSGSSR